MVVVKSTSKFTSKLIVIILCQRSSNLSLYHYNFSLNFKIYLRRISKQ